MTADRLSVSNMRSSHCWTFLQLSVLAVLFLTLNADGEDSECGVEIIGRRGTVIEAFIGEDLHINCTVLFCNNSPPSVSWNKLENTGSVPVTVDSSHFKTQWDNINNTAGIFFLTFQKILTNDSGEYRCQDGNNVGHAISVSVSGNREHNNVTPKNTTNSTPPEQPHSESLWTYLYISAGIVSFVIIVIIISVASMQGCKGKPKKQTQTDNQYMAIPIVERPHSNAPRESPSAPPSRRSTRRTTPSSQPNEPPLRRDNERGNTKEDRERQRNTAEDEGSSLVYAALNHQPPARAAPRPRRQQEEMSEYAAIRVKDY